MTVCVFKGAKKGTKNEENFCSFLASLFFASSFFFSSSQTGVCFCVVVKNTLSLHSKSEDESVWGSLSYSSNALVIKRRGGVLFD